MKTLLIITDGIGYNKSEYFNAFFHAKKPCYDRLFAEVPYGMLDTSGLSVGLPSGQMGNSEVGHMCLGSGRVLYQDLVRINRAMEDGSLCELPALDSIKPCLRVHIVGLFSDGGVHSHIDHMLALANGLQSETREVVLHLVTDGRDVLPGSAVGFVERVIEFCSGKNVRIASICGRFYAMDRDNRWERVEAAYNAIACGESSFDGSPLEYLKAQFDKGVYDEFIEPASFNYEGFESGDGVIFGNFRSDRAREIVDALGNPDFTHFARKRFTQVPLVTMTPYDKGFPYPVLFPKQSVQNTLAEVISRAGLRQLHTAETEKYAHVTFFFNGGVEAPVAGEDRVLVPSPKVATYDLQPQMSAPEVGSAVVSAMENGYDFIVVNFANGDMVGHTGDFDAAVAAVEAVDSELGRIYEVARAQNYAVIQTSDHGNCEAMRSESGEVLTNHTVGCVWCFVTAPEVSAVRDGGLDNIAASVLKLLKLPVPSEMSAALF